jgi:hypothetical protein
VTPELNLGLLHLQFGDTQPNCSLASTKFIPLSTVFSYPLICSSKYFTGVTIEILAFSAAVIHRCTVPVCHGWKQFVLNVMNSLIL